MHQIYSVSIPEYKIQQKPNYTTVGRVIDECIKEHFLDKEIAIRCLSLQDHQGLSVEELIAIIEKTGTDKYDPKRKMSVSHDFYSQKGVELFATPIKVTPNLTLMDEIIKDFYEGAKVDRGYSLKIDLLVIYDLYRLQEIPIIYDDGVGHEAYRFKNAQKKSDALLGFIRIE